MSKNNNVFLCVEHGGKYKLPLRMHLSKQTSADAKEYLRHARKGYGGPVDHKVSVYPVRENALIPLLQSMGGLFFRDEIRGSVSFADLHLRLLEDVFNAGRDFEKKSHEPVKK